jgi:23S rRNA pseudouridine1911/1915/1917 synthase
MPNDAQYLPMHIKARRDGPILDILLEEFGSASKSRIRKMLKYEMIRVGGQTISHADFAIKAGQPIEYVKKTLRDRIDKAPVPIIFEDDCLLVVEKPPGLLTYGEKGTGGTSLYRILKDYIKQRSSGRQGVYVVHRLDREVSGLILFAKDEKIQQQVKANWKRTKKRYYGLVEGRPQNENGTLRSWLKEGPDRKMIEVNQPDGAKLAVTHYRVLKTLPGHTLLEIELETGRKNQVRVHLAGMGCPLVGDRRYGADDAVLRRIRLHSFYLSFPHPVSGRLLEFRSPMPKAFLVLGDKDEVYK